MTDHRFSILTRLFVPAIQTPSPRALPAVAALLILLVAADEAWSQTAFNPEVRIDAQQFILPWDGPGAAVFNPALITKTKRVDGRYAFSETVSGKNGKTIYQGSANSPWGIAVGFNRFTNGSAIDGSNAVFEEANNSMMVAWGGKAIAGTEFDAGVGLAYVRHDYNVFNAVQFRAHAWDLGFQAATNDLGPAGRLHIGLTIRNVAADRVKLPQDNPSLVPEVYNALLYNFDASFLLKSAFDCLDAYLEINAHREHDASEGPTRDGPSPIKSMGVEYRPLPHVGLKIERTWLMRWTAGLIGRGNIPLGEGIEVGVEMDVSHDRFLSPKDEGRGYLWSLALNAGM